MQNKMTNKVFDVTTNGYFILSRKAIQHLMSMIDTHDRVSFYCHLLLEAHYGEPQICTDGITINRGEIRIVPQELIGFTHWKKTKVYEELKLLEEEKLLCRIGKPGKSHYRLPMYEEHCGRAVRKEEHQHPSCLKENQTENSFLGFFQYYHFATGTREVDQEKARREWAKLSIAERDEAWKNVSRYKEAVSKTEHLKLACNYLKDRSFKF